MPGLITEDAITVTIRIYKKLQSNPSQGWANTYEFYKPSTVSGNVDNYQDLVTALMSFEQQFHLTDVLFDRAVVSTLIPDGEPYDPTTFITFPLLEATGLRSIPFDEAEPLNVVLFVRRLVPWGRTGKAYYRRCLGEGDVSAPAGTARLTPASDITTVFNNAVTSFVNDYMNNGNTNLSMVMATVNQNIRNITGLGVAGVRVVKFNNRYFDVP